MSVLKKSEIESLMSIFKNHIDITEGPEIDKRRECDICYKKKDDLCFTGKSNCNECNNKKRCRSCLVIKTKDNFRYEYPDCTTCYARKKNSDYDIDTYRKSKTYILKKNIMI